MRTNLKFKDSPVTHEGGRAVVLSPEIELRRAVMACMLFEDSFYESGVAIADRIKALVQKVSFEAAAQCVIEAREKFKLRHAPLLVVREILRYHSGRKVGDLIAHVIQRPDELGELLAIYWAEKKDAPLPAQLKIGLARALKKFNEYQLAKWNKDGAVKLRDVLFLSHAKPRDEEQAALFKRIAEDKLVTPDTWEVQLSGGADKKATFERLIAEKKLGALALLRNLRGMIEAGVSEDVIRGALRGINTERVLPFRFIAAARYSPVSMENDIEQAMFRAVSEHKKLPGKTAILVDHSGSMSDKVSQKSDITRFEAACALAILLREKADLCRVFAFSDHFVEVANRRGFALRDAVRDCMLSGGTYLGKAIQMVYASFPECERLIVVIDEQSADRPPHPQGLGYIINVAAYQHGIAYGPWVSISGWSESVLDYIIESESV